MKVKSFVIVLICLLSCFAFSQPSKSFIKLRDSLLLLPNDSAKVDALITFCKKYGNSEYKEILPLSKDVFDLATKLKLFKKKAKLYNVIGDVLFNRANYQESFKYYYAGYKLSDSIKNKFYTAMSAYNLGWSAAIQQKNYKDVSYIYMALKIGQEINSDAITLRAENALGSFYTDKFEREKKTADFDSSLKYFTNALETIKALKAFGAAGAIYSNLGQLFYHSKDYTSSTFYYEKAKSTYKQDSNNIVSCLHRVGTCKVAQNKMKEALSIYEFVYRYTTINDMVELKKECLFTLVDYYKTTKEYKKAYDIHNEHTKFEEKINKDLHAFTISNLETDYNYAKSEANNIQLKQAGEIQELKNKRKSIYIFLLIGIGLIIIVIAYLLFRQNKLKQQTNLQLKEQNKTISEKKKEIEQSIEYAKGIQTSFLPDKELLDIFLPNNFIFYQPKDVVSGDFYWFKTSKNKKQILLACSDCTGHGVPGALMSMVGINMLQQFCGTEKLNHPAIILKHLNNETKNALKQNSEQSKQRDGMDIALILLDLETNKLLFSGANRPLYIIRKKEIIELKPTKCAIGGFTKYNQEFEENEVELVSGDLVVLTTDGYADQFGGENGKKFMTKKFKKMLFALPELKPYEQFERVKSEFNTWKADYAQVDDVCVIGISV